MNKIIGLSRYLGGKGGESGAWVSSLLPHDEKGGYCEPFSGMCGVLLHRGVCSVEIVNDLNSFVIDYWRGLQNHHDELKHLISYTPFSRSTYEEAIEIRDNFQEHPLVKRSWAAFVIMNCSFIHALGPKITKTEFSLNYKGTDKLMMKVKDIDNLYERIKHVQLESIDGLKILKRICNLDNFVIYIDPPYDGHKGNINRFYGAAVDKSKLKELLLVQKSKCAVSGYDSEWDSLGWQRFEKNTKARFNNSIENKNRTEVLWCNFEPEQKRQQSQLNIW